MPQLQILHGYSNFANNSIWGLGTRVRINAGLWRVSFGHINITNNDSSSSSSNVHIYILP